MPDNEQLKIAFLDIETAPNLSWVWGFYEQNVLEVEAQWHLLSFSVKWAHEKKPETWGLPDFELWQSDHENDLELTKKLWTVFDEADLIVGHNAAKFDIRKVNTRFLVHGLPPPSPYRCVDTLKIARKVFAFDSNKLGDLCKILGEGQKIKTGGKDLWIACIKGDDAAWKKMKQYNGNDTILSEKLYNRIKAWDPTHPNITLPGNQSYLCPVCGSDKVEKRGVDYLKSYKVQRYHCLVKTCGKWSRGARVKIDADVLS